MTRSLRRAPIFLTLLLPVITFLVIGRTSELNKAAIQGREQPLPNDEAITDLSHVVERNFGLAGGSSAGAGFGMFTLTLLLSC